MPLEPAPLPPDLGAAFSCREALARGASPRRLRAADLTAPHRGVRVVVGDDHGIGSEPAERPDVLARTVRRRAEAYDVVRQPGAFFTHRTALVLLGLPLDRVPGERRSGDFLLSGEEPLRVGVFAPQRTPRARGVHGIQTRSTLVTLRSVGGLPVSSPASTWAMFAVEMDAAALTRLGDAIVRIPRDDRGRRRPELQLATITQLRAAADVPRRRGRRTVDTALDRIRVGSASPLETDWRLAAEAAGLPAFDLDVEIRDERGRLLGIADAAHERYRVIVEVEGDHHRTDRAQWSRDLDKHSSYAAAGWELVRLTSTHIRSGRAITLLGDLLRRRRWRS